MQPALSSDLRIIRVILVLNGLIFMAVAVAFAGWPVVMTGYISVSLQSATSVSDIWAVYGGLQLGVGICLCLFARRQELLYPGLLVCLCCFGGLAGLRGLSFVVDRPKELINVLLWGGELMGLSSALMGLWLWRKRQPPPPSSTAG